MSNHNEPTTADVLDLIRRGQRVQSAAARNKPKRIGDIISQVMARKGYGQAKTASEIEAAWKTVAGSFASVTRVGAVRSGVLTIYVANHAIMQELTFRKRELQTQLAQRLPRHRLRDLRFRDGAGK